MHTFLSKLLIIVHLRTHFKNISSYFALNLLKPEHEISWSPAKIAAVLGSTFAAGTALA